MERLFDRIAKLLGRPETCVMFLASLIPLFGSGFLFNWSATYLLIVSLYLSVPPYCVMFVLLYTTTRDTLANQVQMAELIRVIPGARDELIGLEERSAEEIAALRRK